MATDTWSKFASDIARQKYLRPGETWPQLAHRVASTVLGAVDASPELVSKAERLIRERKFIPGGRYLYATGRPFHQTQNCLLMRAQDSRYGWAQLMNKITMGLMTGAGVGVDYSDLRPKNAKIRRTGGTSTGPVALMQMVNEAGRHIMQGGSRRSALWAGLRWDHADIFDFIAVKNWSPEVKAMKEKDFLFPAPLDGTNISVLLNDEFFEAYRHPRHPKHDLAGKVYWLVVRQMMENGEPGFSVDVGKNAGQTLRNACTEITSGDTDDICNLGSINMARISSLSEMKEVVEVGTAFLLAGTVYSDVPYPEVDQVRTKNRRLGLGLMGLHEFLMKRGLPYGPSEDLAQYLDIYTTSTTYANLYADDWGLTRPVATRAIAPTGTIGILGETTTGMEPIFAAAFKRRYLDGLNYKYQYVLDPTARRLVDDGMDPELIEDAYSLAQEPRRRVQFQAWLQEFVDHGISSTINLPQWGSEQNNVSKVQGFGEMLMDYLPSIRGITCYPDGSRGGQPLTAVPYKEAAVMEGVVFDEAPTDVCDLTRGGTCGS